MTKEEKKQLLTRTTYQDRKKKKKFQKLEKKDKVNTYKEKRSQHSAKKFFRFKRTEDSLPREKVSEQGERLVKKEQGRQLDHFYNWAIILVSIAIILVFVLAFAI